MSNLHHPINLLSALGIHLQLPVIVQRVEIDRRKHYQLRPLFFTHPTVLGRLYDQAVSEFKRELRESLRAFKPNRGNINDLLWYAFNPQLTRCVERMEFTSSGKQFVRGEFEFVYFELRGNVYVCLPAFDSYLFVAEPNAEGTLKKNDIRQQAQLQIDRLFRQYKEELGVSTIDIEPYTAKKGDFINIIDLNVDISQGAFSFEAAQEDWFFAFLNERTDFDGQVELDKVGQNLNDGYPHELKRAAYRDDLAEQLAAILYGEENTPLVLVGREGSGRHTLLDEVIFRYMEQRAPEEETLREQFWKIDPTRIIAGMSIVGMWQKRTEAILQYLRQRPEKEAELLKKKAKGTDKILIDNPVALLRIGKSAQNSMTLSDVLKPYLEKRLLKLLLIATPEEWKIVQDRDRRFADLFQVLRLPEPNMETAVKMTLEWRKRLEVDNECNITIPGIRELFAIQRNFFKRQTLPGAVCRMMSQLAVKHRSDTVDINEVRAEFEAYSGMNIRIFDSEYVFDEGEVERSFEAQLVGQPQAVEALARVVHTTKARLNNPYKPIASFLFVGPTGVGKTEAAKILCRYLLGSEDKLLRFDMNEYVDGSAVARLIGDVHSPEGLLTGRIRYNPFGVLLLDEIEKAHPAVHDLLLQVLDDGRLTDALGRTVDFANLIVIMTSNLGAQEVGMQVGFNAAQSDDSAIYNKAIENFFRPEFVNRIDQIVSFRSLQLEHVLEIAKLQIQNLLGRDGFVRRTTILNVEPQALEWIARRGFHSKMGGRALKRQIEQDLTVFTAEQLVERPGEQSIIFNIFLQDGQLLPLVEPLRFVQPLQADWLPQLPGEGNMHAFYRQLLRQIQTLQSRIGSPSADLDEEEDEDWRHYSDLRRLRAQSAKNYRQEEEPEEEEKEEEALQGHEQEPEGRLIETETDIDWQYYQFKNRLHDLQEHCRRILMGMRTDYLENVPVQLLRLKNTGTNAIIYRNENRRRDVKRILLEEQLFQQSALDELRYVYLNAPEQFDRFGSIYLQDYIELSMLERMAPSFERGTPDRIFLWLRSAVANSGQSEIAYLRSIYERVFADLEVQFDYDEQLDRFTAQGYALYDLLLWEQGYHFFYRSHRNPLPISVLLQRTEEEQPKRIPLLVVRIYDIWMGVEHKNSTLTDLRTGYTNSANITANELKLFLLAAGAGQ